MLSEAVSHDLALSISMPCTFPRHRNAAPARSHSIGSALSSRASIALDQTERSCGVSGLSDAITSAVIRRYRISSADSLKYSGFPRTFPDLTMWPEPDASGVAALVPARSLERLATVAHNQYRWRAYSHECRSRVFAELPGIRTLRCIRRAMRPLGRCRMRCRATA